MTIIQKMADKFDETKLALKVAEEMAELNEVLIKRETKAEELKPPMAKVIEEMGDLLFRLDIYMRKMDIEDAVESRYAEKTEQIEQWFAKKYEN